MNYDDLCPSGKCSYESSGGKDTLGSFPICGKDVPRGYYVSACLLAILLLFNPLSISHCPNVLFGRCFAVVAGTILVDSGTVLDSYTMIPSVQFGLLSSF